MPYSAKDIARILDIGESTARLWAREFDIPKQKNKRKVYDKEALEIFETIKSLRLKDAGYNTITKVIKENDLAPTKRSLASSKQTLSQEFKKSIQSEIKSGIEDAKQVLSTEISKNNELAEKYARATFEIGQLQERVKHLEEKLESKEDEIKLLPAALEHEKLKMRAESQQSELESKNQQIEDLQKQLKIEQTMPWWKKLFKR